MSIKISGVTADGVTVSRDFTELEIHLIASSSPVLARAISQLFESIKAYEAKQRKCEQEKG